MSIAKNILNIPAVNGTVTRSVNALAFQHHLAISTDVPGTGTLEIKARPPGATAFEAIPDAGAIDLASPVSVQVTGVVEEYELTLASVSGATLITITDTCEVL